MKVIYLPTAVQDLASIYKYISRDSVKYAKLEVHKIKAFAESIKNQPLAGKLYQTMHGKQVRSLVFRHYILFYTIEESRINILTIHHHARLFANNPAFKDEE
ncbi:MAG TPA: type II toxin-antitoxin system RelE/ParE family toxin [Mucilaginibacter sp.]|nr:type II toxin-antitoxin system RelE/ParE family toxin [Mucilaginibacter sp.]